MSRLTRDGTAKPVSRDQNIRRKRGQGIKYSFFLQLTTRRIGNLTQSIHTLRYVMTIFYKVASRGPSFSNECRIRSIEIGDIASVFLLYSIKRVFPYGETSNDL